MTERTIDESRASISNVMLPSQANPAGNVHGGEIMKLMDVCGSVTAMRHARSNVVTVRVDELVFYHPVFVGQLVTCESNLVFAGTTSMEICVTVRVENLTGEGEPKTALTAYFSFVALDEAGHPCPVPRLKLLTEQEMDAFELGRKRYEKYKRRRLSKD